MEALENEYSLFDELNLHNHYEIVAEKNGKFVYSHTVYYELSEEDYEDFITEDDEPMDNLFSEKEQRKLVSELQDSAIDWTDRNFMACANVAIYYEKGKCIVPDMFLSMDVKHPKSWRAKKDKCYYAWQMGKLPELVLEIVSNKVGNEDTEKMELYAKLGIKYYVIHDPYLYLSEQELRVYELKANAHYVLLENENNFMPEINLGIQLWQGLFEKEESLWARWCTREGEYLMTGAQRAEQEKKRADEEAKLKELAEQKAEEEKLEKEREKQRADEEAKKAEEEKQRADIAEEEIRKLKAQLEALGLKKED